MTSCVLTINAGSSSVKFALFRREARPSRIFSGEISRIGQPDARFSIRRAEGQAPEQRSISAPDHQHAVAELLSALKSEIGSSALAGIGHRVVHGGTRYFEPAPVTAELLAELRRLAPLDPTHLPAEIALIEAFAARLPDAPQVACFDTAFHHGLPQVAQILPVPRRYFAAGVRRFGFHGLSYEYLLEEVARVAGPAAAQGRLIFAHLGAGASLAAVKDGKCIDTTMAFTPTAGLVMATRSGDVDPGFLLYLLRTEKLSADQLDELLNRQSGLLGISETAADMRDLLARAENDPRAADAVAVFCYQAKKWLGAFAAALGGLDGLVFAGGIGENSPQVRWGICEGLSHLGIALDPARNRQNAGLISDDKHLPVRVIRTDEEWVIARAVCGLLDQT